MSVHQKKAVVFFISLTVLIDTAGLGIIFPVLPKLITSLGHTDISTAARYGGWLAFIYAAMQFVFAPVMGNLSDAVGRRPVLLLSLLGFSIDYMLLAFAPSLPWLFAGRMIAGITGASYVVGAGYMADISSGEDRTRNFGLLNAAMGLGFIMGPALGGVLVHFGTKAPFVATAVLSMLNVIFGYCVLPESLAPAHRRPFKWKEANPLGAVRQLGRFPQVLLPVVAVLLLSFANHVMETIWAYFTLEKFGWTPQLIGVSLGFMGVMFVGAQAWLVGVAVKDGREERAALFGLFITAAAFLCFAFTGWQWGLFLGLLLQAVGSIAETALQGMLSARVPADEQGALQGSLGCLKGITAFVAPPVYAASFAAFTGKSAVYYFPGMPFVVAALFVMGSLVLLATVWKSRPEKC